MEGDLGGSTPFQRGPKTSNVFGFDCDNFHFRAQCFHCERNSGDQTAAANRYEYGIEVWNRFDDLEAHRSLSGDDRQIVVTIDVSETLFGSDFVRVRLCFAKMCAVQNDLGAELLAIGHFYERSVFGHDDGGGN